MGGQACVFYGAAEFSRDCDIVVLAEDSNFEQLENAIADLQAECIAVPPMEWSYLERGHAIHFRCKHPDALNIRLDVMTRMRGCDEFPLLWERRTTLEDADGTVFEILGIEDLIKAKKTQRDKDWPMIRRLVEAHYDQFQFEPTPERIRFWLRESRSPEMLLEVATRYPDLVSLESVDRPLLQNSAPRNSEALLRALEAEQKRECEADAEYWSPLKKELEQLHWHKNH